MNNGVRLSNACKLFEAQGVFEENQKNCKFAHKNMREYG
jgi:hypothetical protein